MGALSPFRIVECGLRNLNPKRFSKISVLSPRQTEECEIQNSPPSPLPLPEGRREIELDGLPSETLACQLRSFRASSAKNLAEREGFEPSIPLLTGYSLSRRAPSASRASLHVKRVPVRSGNAPYIIILIALTAISSCQNPLFNHRRLKPAATSLQGRWRRE